MNTGLPPTSLLISTRNRPKLISETIDSILAGNEVPTEIVVIDQSSASHPTLATLSTTRPCQVRYIQSPTIGVSRSRNEALSIAQYDWIAITDDDIFFHPEWFRILMQTQIAAGPRTVVTGQVRPEQIEKPGQFVPSTIDDPNPAVYQGRIMTDVLYAANMTIHRSVIDVIGNFDVRLGPGTIFPSAEDNDFGFRLLEAGYQIQYCPEAIVYHRAWRTSQDYVPLRWDYGRGQGAFFAKHLSLRDHFMLRRMVNDYRRYMLRFLRYLFTRSRQQTMGDIAMVSGLASGSIEWLMRYGPSR